VGRNVGRVSYVKSSHFSVVVQHLGVKMTEVGGISHTKNNYTCTLYILFFIS